MPPTRPRKFGRGFYGILATTCTSLPRTVRGSIRWNAGSPYCHSARSNEVRTTACVNWKPRSPNSSPFTTSSPSPLCGPRVPMRFSTALAGSLPALWRYMAQRICQKSMTQETRNHPKDIDAAHSHLKNRMHRLQHIRQTLKRGLLSVGQFSSKPQHNLMTVITVQELGKKCLQIEIFEKEVFLADFQNGCVQLRLKRLRA